MFEEAGIRVQQVNVPPSPVKLIGSNNGTPAGLAEPLIHPPSPTSSAEVMMTLNRLNAQEELDGEEDHLDTDFVEEEEVVTG